MAVAWNYENAAHLLRRAAFGGTPEKIEAFLDKHGSVEEAVDELLSFRPSSRKPPGPKNIDTNGLRKMQRWWLKRMLRAKKQDEACHEKLVLFLHGLLVSGVSKQETLTDMAFQNRLFRLNARGNYRQLIREFNRDPANLYYLDGILNVASNDGIHVNANENWGRELLELFTLGVFQLQADGTADPTKPNYTEDDVHNVSRACTGWTDISNRVGVFTIDDWDGGQYDDDGDGFPDPMVIFGQTSNNFRIDEGVAGTGDDILELIFGRTDDDGNNQVGMYLSEKLWTWYAYAPPAPGLKTLLAGFAAVFAGAEFEITPLLRALWTHDEFYSDRAKTRTIRNPADYVIQAMRALDVRGSAKFIGDASDELNEKVARMGMELFEPPNVAGWPGGLTWVSSGTLFERMKFAKDLGAADFGSSRVRLSNITALPLGNPAADPGQVVDAVVHQMGLDIGPLALNATHRAALLDYATDNGLRTSLDLSHESTPDAEEKVRGLIALVLQSAEAQIF
jgi:uncharacterized protein (DUF1800 family)